MTTVWQHILFTAVTTSGSLDTAISLYAPSGKREANTWDAFGHGGDELDWTLKETGKYTIVVQDNNLQESGSYNVTFLNLPGGPLTSAG